VLKERVAELRPAYLAPDPVSRTSYEAGDIAQCDRWFPPIQLPVGFGQQRRPVQLPVLTMVTGYSRWLSGQLMPTRAAPDLFAGWWQVIERLGAVARTLVWDGGGAIGRWRHGKTELTRECQAFRGTLGTKVIVLKPAEPEHKGIIERAHDDLETSFLPGRRFTGPWFNVVNARRRALGIRMTSVGLRDEVPGGDEPAPRGPTDDSFTDGHAVRNLETHDPAARDGRRRSARARGESHGFDSSLLVDCREIVQVQWNPAAAM
jgi:transposase